MKGKRRDVKDPWCCLLVSKQNEPFMEYPAMGPAMQN